MPSLARQVRRILRLNLAFGDYTVKHCTVRRLTRTSGSTAFHKRGSGHRPLILDLDILAIAAHPDDVELTCGGTVIKMVEANTASASGISPLANRARAAASPCAPENRAARVEDYGHRAPR